MVVSVKLMSMFAKYLKNHPDGRIDVKDGTTVRGLAEALSDSHGQIPVQTINNSLFRSA